MKRVLAIIVKKCNNRSKNIKVFRKYADIHYISYMRCVMSNFTVNGVYSSKACSNLVELEGTLPKYE